MEPDQKDSIVPSLWTQRAHFRLLSGTENNPHPMYLWAGFLLPAESMYSPEGLLFPTSPGRAGYVPRLFLSSATCSVPLSWLRLGHFGWCSEITWLRLAVNPMRSFAWNYPVSFPPCDYSCGHIQPSPRSPEVLWNKSRSVHPCLQGIRLCNLTQPSNYTYE